MVCITYCKRIHRMGTLPYCRTASAQYLMHQDPDLSINYEIYAFVDETVHTHWQQRQSRLSDAHPHCSCGRNVRDMCFLREALLKQLKERQKWKQDGICDLAHCCFYDSRLKYTAIRQATLWSHGWPPWSSRLLYNAVRSPSVSVHYTGLGSYMTQQHIDVVTQALHFLSYQHISSIEYSPKCFTSELRYLTILWIEFIFYYSPSSSS